MVFATMSQVTAAANAINDCDVQAVFNPVEIYAIDDRMNCIQTGTLVVNVRAFCSSSPCRHSDT